MIYRPSDEILNLFNRFSDAKLTGVVNPDELKTLLIKIGDLFANKIKKGEVSIDDIDSAETLIEGFISENKDNYFSHLHSDLDGAAKTFLEGDYVALESIRKRDLQSKPIDDYSKSLRKIA